MPEKYDTSSASGLDIDRIDFLSVFDRLDDGVIISDMEGTILFYNRTQSKIDGLNPDDVMGGKVVDIYELNHQTSLIMQCVRTRRAIKNKTFFYRSISGKVANTITSVYPLFDGNRVNGAICFVKDYELLQKSAPSVAVSECRPDLGNGTRYTFADLIGSSDGFCRVMGAARMAANSSSPIMIQGETGTGKELFAQSIHNHSRRHRKRFVGVNCGAIPHDLLEGLLFGTSKGSFTGALDKPGLFEIANGGTLFLDELLAMPIDLQAKLLRVLQEKKVRRLGSLDEIDVDVKIISSVSQDPRLALKNGDLRMDLFYRLGVVILKLPPLRQRRDGMAELINHFIQKCNVLLGTHVKKVSSMVMELFMSYQWPGNIRELEHLIEGAMNMAGHDKVLDIRHFSSGAGSWQGMDTSPETDGDGPEETGDESQGAASSQDPAQEEEMASFSRSILNKMTRMDIPDGHRAPETAPASLGERQARQEREAIRNALQASGGNVTQASQVLGLSRQLLHYKMKKHHIRRIDFVPRS